MSSDRSLKVAVVGFGTMGRKHAANCTRIEGVEVVAIAGVDDAEAAVVRSEAQVPAFASAEKMLGEVAIDALLVATPPGVRREVVELAAAKGMALFLEKPIALDLATAEGYCRGAAASRAVNAVGFQLRYSPLAERAKEAVAGRPVTHVRTACTTDYYLNRDVPDWFLQRAHSGGPLLEQAIHVIDMARYLVGDISHVFARGHRLTYPGVQHLDSEDTIVLAYQFASGALGTHMDSTATSVFNWEIELLGPDWRLMVDFARKRLSGYCGEEPIEESFADLDLHQIEMQAFIDAVRGEDNDGIRSDFADATETLATVLAGDRSIRTANWEPVRG